MSDLQPASRALFVAARASFEPSVEDRRRVAQSVALALGAGGSLGASAAAASTAVGGTGKGASTLVAVKWLAVVAAIGGGASIGGVSLYGARHRHTAMTASPVSSTQPSSAANPRARVAPSVPSTATPESAQEVIEFGPSAETRALSSSSPSSPAAPRTQARVLESKSVEQEARLLADAGAALRAGDAARALQLLDEHAQYFPHGAMVEERLGERVLVLCALGQTEAARGASVGFLTQYPESPLASRVRSSCAGRGL